MTRVSPDALVAGALDLHAHGSPEFTPAMPGRVSNLEWARLARAAGMRGFVMKSHVFPTVGTVDALRTAVPGLDLFGSITLNPTAGGLSPLSVELAIEAGAKVVWMPTWSARHKVGHSSLFLERMVPYIDSVDPAFWPASGLTVLDGDGKLTADVDKIIQICARKGAVVAGGHLPVASSVAVCRRVRELGGQFVLTHPLNSAVAASIEHQLEIAALGGVIEHVFVGCLPMHHRLDPRHIVESIEAVGPEHCVMSSDAIEGWNPPEPELMRMFIASLQALGVDSDAIYQMTHDNPATVLGLPLEWSSSASGEAS